MPFAVLYATDTGVVEACESVTVKTALVVPVAVAVTATSLVESDGNTGGGGV